MPLWGALESNERKPLYLNEEQRIRTFATNEGWVIRNEFDPSKTEVLVAISGLEDKLGNPQVDSMYQIERESANAASDLSVVLVWNSRVNVEPSAYLTFSNAAANFSGNLVFDGYVGHANSNQTIFTYTPNSVNVTATFTLGTAIAGGNVISVTYPSRIGNANLASSGFNNNTDVRITITESLIA